MKSCLLIFNPISGDNEFSLENLRDRAVSELPNHEVIQYETTGEKDDLKIKELSESKNPDLILIAGGDGTIKLVCNALQGCDRRIGVIPIGSANGLAKCLGINSMEEAWMAIKELKFSAVDALRLGGDLCLHLADFGLNAGLVKSFEKEGKRGMAGYAKNYFSEIFNGEMGRFTLEMDGQNIDVEAKMLVIANGSQYGTGAKINTEGKMNDGLFELIALNPETLLDHLDGTLAMFRGKLNEKDVYQYWQGKSCRIHNHDGLDFQIDGEVKDQLAILDVEVIKHAFVFLVGENFQCEA
jgi:diacylglycerol kinase family enzyme